MKGVSCVPTGLYELAPHNSEKHGRTWALRNASLWVYQYEDDIPAAQRGRARSACVIHSANRPEELAGCIAPGLERDPTIPAVWSSRKAMAAIRKVLSWEMGHMIEIR